MINAIKNALGFKRCERCNTETLDSVFCHLTFSKGICEFKMEMNLCSKCADEIKDFIYKHQKKSECKSEYIYILEQDADWTEQEAMFKLKEEVEEFQEAVAGEGDAHILEEGFDIIQSVISYLSIRGFTRDEISDALKKHNKKLDDRCWDRHAAWEIPKVEGE